MTTNIYDTANALEQEIRKMKEFKEMKEAFQHVQKDETASQLFKSFQNFQLKMQQKQMQGQDFTEEDNKEAKEITAEVQKNSLITTLMEKEQLFNVILQDLNRIIMSPVRDVYEGK